MERDGQATFAHMPRALPNSLCDPMFWTWLDESTGAEQWEALPHLGLNWVAEPEADRDAVAYLRLFRAALLARYDPELVHATAGELRAKLPVIVGQPSESAKAIAAECDRVRPGAVDYVDALLDHWIDVVPPSMRHERRVQPIRGPCIEALFGPEPIMVEEDLYDLSKRGKLAQLCQLHGWSDTIPLREVRDRTLDTVWHMQCARLLEDQVSQLNIVDRLASATTALALLDLVKEIMEELDDAAPASSATHAEVLTVVNGWRRNLSDVQALYATEQRDRLGDRPLRSLLLRLCQDLQVFVEVHCNTRRLLHLLHCRFRQHATAGVTAELDCGAEDNARCVVTCAVPIGNTGATLVEVGLRTDLRYVTAEPRGSDSGSYVLRALPEGAQAHGDSLDNILLDPVRTHGKHAPVISVTLSNLKLGEDIEAGVAADGGLVVDFADVANGAQSLWHHRTAPCTLARSTTPSGHPYVRIALAIVGAEKLGDAVVRVVTGPLGEDPYFVAEDSLVVAEVLERLAALLRGNAVAAAAREAPLARAGELRRHAADRRIMFAVGPVLQRRMDALVQQQQQQQQQRQLVASRYVMWAEQLDLDPRILDDADDTTPTAVLFCALTESKNVFLLPLDTAHQVLEDAARLAMLSCASRTLEPDNVAAVMDDVHRLRGSVRPAFLLLVVGDAVEPIDLARLVESVKGTPVRLLLVRSDYVVESLREVGLQSVLGNSRAGESAWEQHRPAKKLEAEREMLPHWTAAAAAERHVRELAEHNQLQADLRELLNRLCMQRGAALLSLALHERTAEPGLLIIVAEDMDVCKAECRRSSHVVDVAQPGNALDILFDQVETTSCGARPGDVLVLANSHLMPARLKRATLLRAASVRLPVAFLTRRLDPADLSINLGSAHGQLEARVVRHHASAAELTDYISAAASLGSESAAARQRLQQLVYAARMLKMLFGGAFEAGMLASAVGAGTAGFVAALTRTLHSAVDGVVDAEVVAAVVAEVCRVTELATPPAASSEVQGLVYAVRCAVEVDPSGTRDVSFQQFMEAHALCHDAPQSMRAYLWLQLLKCARESPPDGRDGRRGVLLRDFDAEDLLPMLDDALLLPECAPSVSLVCWDVQTPQVCSLLSARLAGVHNDPDAPSSDFDRLSYLVAKQPGGRTLVQHTLVQLQGGLEAPWHALTSTQALAASFEDLMTMVRVGSVPLKVVRTVQPERLFELLHCVGAYEAATGLVPDALAKLAMALAEPLNQRVLQEAMPHHWAVLKWHFAGTHWEAATGAELPFSREDLERLFDLRVPVSFTSESGSSSAGHTSAARELASALGRSEPEGLDFMNASSGPAVGVELAPTAATDAELAAATVAEVTTEERRRAWLECMLHIVRRMDGLPRDLLNSLLELRHSLLRAPAGDVAHLLCLPTSQSRASMPNTPSDAAAMGTDELASGAAAAVAAAAADAEASSAASASDESYSLMRVAASPIIGSAIVDFLMNESVMRAAAEVEARAQPALFIRSPFARWLHSWLQPSARGDSLLGGPFAAEDIVSMPDADIWPRLLPLAAAEEVWACMYALSAPALALLMSAAPSEAHAAVAYRVAVKVLAARAGQWGVDVRAVTELLSGLASHPKSRTRLSALDWLLWRSGPLSDVLQSIVRNGQQLASIPGVSAEDDPDFYFVLLALRDQSITPLVEAIPHFPVADVPCCAKLWLATMSDTLCYFDSPVAVDRYGEYAEYVQNHFTERHLPGENERRRVLQHLLRNNGRFRTSTGEEFSCRALMLVLWLEFPQEAVQLESGAHEILFLLALCRLDGQEGSTFASRVYASLGNMSALALFIAAPHLLTLAVYNDFANAFGQFVDRGPIELRLVLVGQRGGEDAQFPAYFMQLYRRSLPDWRVAQLRQELRALVQRVHAEPDKFPLLRAISERGANMLSDDRVKPVDFSKNPVLFLKLCFLLDVSSGVSAEALLNNLAMLYVAVRCCNCLESLSKVKEVPPTLFYAHNVLWAWFFALGWGKAQVLDWMQEVFPELHDGTSNAIWRSAVEAVWGAANAVDHTFSTLLPFPAVLDLRDAATSGDRTFMGVMPDDALYTLQLCSALVPSASDPVLDEVLGGQPLRARVPRLTLADLLTTTRPVTRTKQYLSLPEQYGRLFGQIMAVRLAQPGMLQSAEAGTVEAHRRFDNLDLPQGEAAGAVANAAVEGAAWLPLVMLPCVRVAVQLGELQLKITPLATLMHRLNAAHDRVGAPEVDVECLKCSALPEDAAQRPLAMMGALVKAVVGAVHATLQDLVPDEERRGYLQAAFFRALFATVGVTPLQNTQRIHGAIVYHYSKLGMRLCGWTVRELNCWPRLSNTHWLPLLGEPKALVRGSMHPVLILDAEAEAALTAQVAQDMLQDISAWPSTLPLVRVEPERVSEVSAIERGTSTGAAAAAAKEEDFHAHELEEQERALCPVLTLAVAQDRSLVEDAGVDQRHEEDLQYIPAPMEDAALIAVFDDVLQLGATADGSASFSSSAVSVLPCRQVAMVEVKPVAVDPWCVRGKLVVFIPWFAATWRAGEDGEQALQGGVLERLGVPREGVVVTVRTTFNSTQEAWQHLCAANTRSAVVLNLRQGFALLREKRYGPWKPAFVAFDSRARGVEFWDRSMAAVMLDLTLPDTVRAAVQELALAVLALSGLWESDRRCVGSYLHNSAGVLVPNGALHYLATLGSPTVSAMRQQACGAASKLCAWAQRTLEAVGSQEALAADARAFDEALSSDDYRVDDKLLHDRLARALHHVRNNRGASALLRAVLSGDLAETATGNTVLYALRAVTSPEFTRASWATLQSLTEWVRRYGDDPVASERWDAHAAEPFAMPGMPVPDGAAAEGYPRDVATPVAAARAQPQQEWAAISSLASVEPEKRSDVRMAKWGRVAAPNDVRLQSTAERKRLEEQQRPPAVSSLWGVPCDRLVYLRDIPDEEFTGARGERVMFVVTAQLFDGCDGDAATMQRMRRWVVDVLRGPIHPSLAEAVLQHAAFPGLAALPLPRSVLQFPRFSDVGPDAEEPRTSKRALSEFVVYYGLARRCPLVVTRDKCERAAKAQLCLLLALGEIHDLLTRVGGDAPDQYAMHEVSSENEIPQLLWDVGVTCCVLDVGAGVQAGTVTEAHIYNRVRRLALDRGSPFVLIRGLPTLSDRLFKLLSEFTQRTPWVAVLLEDTETRWLLPENQDRLVKSKRTETTAAHFDGAALRRHTVRFDQQLAAEPVVQEAQFWAGTALQEGWEDVVRRAFTTDDESWIVLTGSAGIGKTYFIRDELLPRVEGTLISRFVGKDASNDEFLRKSVVEVMEEELAGVPHDCKRLLLLLDGAHMGSPGFLRRFLDSATRHHAGRRDVKLVMISNRLDKEALSELEGTSMRRPPVTIIRARGSVEKLLTVRVFDEAAWGNAAQAGADSDLGAPYQPGSMSEERCKLVLLAFVFTRVTNALFGDLAMSLRHVPGVLAELSTLQGTVPHLRDYGPLARLLQYKFVMLPAPFCVALVRAMSQLLDELCQGPVWRDAFQGVSRFMEAFAGGDAAGGRGESESFLCSGGSYNRGVAQSIAASVLTGDLPGAIHIAQANGAQARRGLFLVVLSELLRGNVAKHCSGQLEQALDAPDRLEQAVQALVLAGPADMEGDSMPYPEFVTSGALARGLHHHPLMRISCWLVYVKLRARLRFGGERPASALLHEQLRQLAPRMAARLASECTVSDLPMQFPQLHMGRPSALGACEVVSADVDPRNVEELVQALERGFSFDEEAAKEAWAQSPVLTADQLERLLTARPDLLRVLAAPGRFQRQLLNHLRMLVSLGKPSLARRCLNLDLPEGRSLLDMAEDPSWPPLIAMWRLYRHEDVRRLAVGTWLGGSSLFEQACMFLWAARFGFSLCSVPDHVETRESLLRRHLLLVSAYILRARRDSAATEAEKALRKRGAALVAELWSSQFAALLPEPGQEAQAFSADELRAAAAAGIVEFAWDVCLPPMVLVAIAASQYPAKQEWPGLVRQISSLLRGMLSATEASVLVLRHKNLLTGMLRDSPELARRLLECELSFKAQRELLASTCRFPEQVSTLQQAHAFVEVLQAAPVFDEAVCLPESDMRTALFKLWQQLHRHSEAREEASTSPLLFTDTKLRELIRSQAVKRRRA